MGLNNNSGTPKFTEPIPTKSGRKVKEIWDELQEQKQKFKTSNLNDDEDNKVLSAIRINELEDDLGLSITPFSFFSEQDTND